MLKADDGRFAFQISNQRYVSIDGNKDGLLIANQKQIGNEELFQIEEQDNCFIALKANNGKYVSIGQDNGLLKATARFVGKTELFRVMIKKDQIAMKDPITVNKTISIKIDVLNHDEIVKHEKGKFWGTVLYFTGKKRVEAEIKNRVVQGFNDDAKLQQFVEEFQTKISEELSKSKIKATVVVDIK